MAEYVQLSLNGKPTAFDTTSSADLIVATPSCLAFFQSSTNDCKIGNIPSHIIHYEQPQPIVSLKCHKYFGISSIATLRAGVVSIWDGTHSLRPLQTSIQNAVGSTVTDMQWQHAESASPKVIATCTSNGVVSMWDIRTSPSSTAVGNARNGPNKSVTIDASGYCYSLNIHPSNSNLIAVQCKNSVTVHDVRRSNETSADSLFRYEHPSNALGSYERICQTTWGNAQHANLYISTVNNAGIVEINGWNIHGSKTHVECSSTLYAARDQTKIQQMCPCPYGLGVIVLSTALSLKNVDELTIGATGVKQAVTEYNVDTTVVQCSSEGHNHSQLKNSNLCTVSSIMQHVETNNTLSVPDVDHVDCTFLGVRVNSNNRNVSRVVPTSNAKFHVKMLSSAGLLYSAPLLSSISPNSAIYSRNDENRHGVVPLAPVHSINKLMDDVVHQKPRIEGNNSISSFNPAAASCEFNDSWLSASVSSRLLTNVLTFEQFWEVLEEGILYIQYLEESSQLEALVHAQALQSTNGEGPSSSPLMRSNSISGTSPVPDTAARAGGDASAGVRLNGLRIDSLDVRGKRVVLSIKVSRLCRDDEEDPLNSSGGVFASGWSASAAGASLMGSNSKSTKGKHRHNFISRQQILSKKRSISHDIPGYNSHYAAHASDYIVKLIIVFPPEFPSSGEPTFAVRVSVLPSDDSAVEYDSLHHAQFSDLLTADLSKKMIAVLSDNGPKTTYGDVSKFIYSLMFEISLGFVEYTRKCCLPDPAASTSTAGELDITGVNSVDIVDNATGSGAHSMSVNTSADSVDDKVTSLLTSGADDIVSPSSSSSSSGSDSDTDTDNSSTDSSDNSSTDSNTSTDSDTDSDDSNDGRHVVAPVLYHPRMNLKFINNPVNDNRMLLSPRTSGGIFSPNGRLLCFGGAAIVRTELNIHAASSNTVVRERTLANAANLLQSPGMVKDGVLTAPISTTKSVKTTATANSSGSGGDSNEVSNRNSRTSTLSRVPSNVAEFSEDLSLSMFSPTAAPGSHSDCAHKRPMNYDEYLHLLQLDLECQEMQRIDEERNEAERRLQQQQAAEAARALALAAQTSSDSDDSDTDDHRGTGSGKLSSQTSNGRLASDSNASKEQRELLVPDASSFEFTSNHAVRGISPSPSSDFSQIAQDLNNLQSKTMERKALSSHISQSHSANISAGGPSSVSTAIATPKLRYYVPLLRQVGVVSIDPLHLSSFVIECESMLVDLAHCCMLRPMSRDRCVNFTSSSTSASRFLPEDTIRRELMLMNCIDMEAFVYPLPGTISALSMKSGWLSAITNMNTDGISPTGVDTLGLANSQSFSIGVGVTHSTYSRKQANIDHYTEQEKELAALSLISLPLSSVGQVKVDSTMGAGSFGGTLQSLNDFPYAASLTVFQHESSSSLKSLGISAAPSNSNGSGYATATTMTNDTGVLETVHSDMSPLFASDTNALDAQSHPGATHAAPPTAVALSANGVALGGLSRAFGHESNTYPTVSGHGHSFSLPIPIGKDAVSLSLLRDRADSATVHGGSPGTSLDLAESQENVMMAGSAGARKYHSTPRRVQHATNLLLHADGMVYGHSTGGGSTSGHLHGMMSTPALTNEASVANSSDNVRSSFLYKPHSPSGTAEHASMSSLLYNLAPGVGIASVMAGVKAGEAHSLCRTTDPLQFATILTAAKAATCRYNALVTKIHNQLTIATLWLIAGLAFDLCKHTTAATSATAVDSALSLDGKSKYPDWWLSAALGGRLIGNLLSYCSSVGDLHSFTTLLCILCSGIDHPREVIITLDRVCNTDLCSIMDGALCAYSDLLHRWGLDVRATIVQSFISTEYHAVFSDQPSIVPVSAAHAFVPIEEDEEAVELEKGFDLYRASTQSRMIDLDVRRDKDKHKLRSSSEGNLLTSRDDYQLARIGLLQHHQHPQLQLAGEYCLSVTETPMTVAYHCGFCDGVLSSDSAVCPTCLHPHTECRQAIRCAICEEACTKLVNFCHVCGHGGHIEHLYYWFKTNDQCPTGCGCRCNDLYAPPVSPDDDDEAMSNNDDDDDDDDEDDVIERGKHSGHFHSTHHNHQQHDIIPDNSWSNFRDITDSYPGIGSGDGEGGNSVGLSDDEYSASMLYY